jgi:adenosylcobinamide kinase / adenosylcobinamide-phosphate guanylyltransferase
MAEIILVTGGCRSGKSNYAQKIAESDPGTKTFIATCPCLDEEMAERIRKHKKARNSSWFTVEETLDLAGALSLSAASPVILVDCLTLWINNLLYDADVQGREFREEDMVRQCRKVLDSCSLISGKVIFVTNETGMGIVPADPLTRRFRDIAGRCNQSIAEKADSVVFMVSGIPLTVKGDICK